MFDLINPYMVKANESAGWNFQIDWIESVQISRYSKNEFYDWHVDQYPKPYSPIARSKDIGKINKEKIVPRNKNYIGKIRKLSMTINLTDPTTYKGGRMHFDSPSWTKPTIRECLAARAQGSVVVFPSFILHRVTPVTEGTRYSLVAWFLGKPFR
jgi:PKHD-type hydroxylase